MDCPCKFPLRAAGQCPHCPTPMRENGTILLPQSYHWRSSTIKLPARETREGWRRLTVETELNGDSKSTNERGSSLVGSLGLSCRKRDFCPALASLVDPVQNVFSSPLTISMPLSPSPSKLGKQPCWVACLLVYVPASSPHSIPCKQHILSNWALPRT